MLNSFDEILSMSVIVFLGIWQVLKESWRFTAKKKTQRNQKPKTKPHPPTPPPSKKTPNNLKLEKSWKIRRKLDFRCIIHNKYMNKGFSIHCTLLIYARNTSCVNLEGEESGRSRTPPPGKKSIFSNLHSKTTKNAPRTPWQSLISLGATYPPPPWIFF